MSAVLVLIIVILMLNVATLLGASPVPVTKDTVEMGLTVLVSFPYQGIIVLLAVITNIISHLREGESLSV